MKLIIDCIGAWFILYFYAEFASPSFTDSGLGTAIFVILLLIAVVVSIALAVKLLALFVRLIFTLAGFDK